MGLTSRSVNQQSFLTNRYGWIIFRMEWLSGKRGNKHLLPGFCGLKSKSKSGLEQEPAAARRRVLERGKAGLRPTRS
ncbi:hypothetical protein XACLE20_440030 [Xanthomonas citri pv. citri]|nr:hypothetical protein XACLE20_440030 [Xanthomonas citri pv. citri]CEH59469.1 hypothetical protein XACLE3_8680023 [Xanthomonas citri pv. citri]